VARTPSTMVPLGRTAPDFTLRDPVTGGTVSRDDVRTDGGLLVIFLSNHCPYVKHVAGELAAFAREYRDKGLGIVAIGSNDAEAYPDDRPDLMAREVEARGYVFPYLHDDSQEVAKAYEAACTPDFFLFDGEGRLVYRGQFDESRPSNGVEVTGADLRAACDALLSGATVSEAQTPSLGCNIKWKPGNAPAWFG